MLIHSSRSQLLAISITGLGVSRGIFERSTFARFFNYKRTKFSTINKATDLTFFWMLNLVKSIRHFPVLLSTSFTKVPFIIWEMCSKRVKDQSLKGKSY